VVSSPLATDETRAMDREIESRKGIGGLTFSLKSNKLISEPGNKLTKCWRYLKTSDYKNVGRVLALHMYKFLVNLFTFRLCLASS
jgi:hypothetical protein